MYNIQGVTFISPNQLWGVSFVLGCGIVWLLRHVSSDLWYVWLFTWVSNKHSTLIIPQWHHMLVFLWYLNYKPSIMSAEKLHDSFSFHNAYTLWSICKFVSATTDNHDYSKSRIQTKTGLGPELTKMTYDHD